MDERYSEGMHRQTLNEKENIDMTHRERMENGLWYDANFDPELLALRENADELCFRFNHTSPKKSEEKERLLSQLIPRHGNDTVILAPIYADYGVKTTIGDGTFINHNAYLMDGGTITIGRHCFIGPNCGMYTAGHPLNPEERNKGLERALPIVIEDNVWIGADVTILPGVTIGEGAVIGGKSCVTKDVPAGVIAVGNPCRVMRPITEEDRIGELGIDDELG